MSTPASSSTTTKSTSATPFFNVGGIATGLDTNSIIDQLLALDRQPETLLTQQSTVETARQAALKSIQTSMQALQSATRSKDSLSIGDRRTGSLALSTPMIQPCRATLWGSRFDNIVTISTPEHLTWLPAGYKQNETPFKVVQIARPHGELLFWRSI